MNDSILSQAKLIPCIHNVSIKVIDNISGKVVSSHTGHNAATMSLINGIGHYLTGDGILNQGYHMLSDYIPRYISLGTMGLLNQDQDGDGLPVGLGAIDLDGNLPDDEGQRLADYLMQAPGFGADGYDMNTNNGRLVFGLGPMYKDRQPITAPELIYLGNVSESPDGKLGAEDVRMLADYLLSHQNFNDRQKVAADINQDGKITWDDLEMLRDYVDHPDNYPEGFGSVSYIPKTTPAIGCELISESFPRAKISYREIVPETDSELPQTIDVVFSALISTGALAQFRGNNDYIFITEAGLWSKREWTDGGDNGLLAGYRIANPDKLYWGTTVKSVTDEALTRYLETELGYDEAQITELFKHPEQVEAQKQACAMFNRKLLKESIIKVGRNQVVQVIWKVQIGALEQLGGVGDLYGTSGALYWVDWDDE